MEAAARTQAEKADLAPFFNEAMVDYAERLVRWSGTMDWAVPVKNCSDATNLALRAMRSERQKPLVILFTSAYHDFDSEIALMPEHFPNKLL